MDTVIDRLGQRHGGFSVEFFPPRDAASEQQLQRTARQIEPYDPAFVSVTYGAGGSSRDRTVDTVRWFAEQTGLHVVGHLAAVDHSIAELRNVVGHYAASGVRSVLAIRGDPPGDPAGEWIPRPDGVTYARDLVRLLRTMGPFCVGVAGFPYGHPRSPDLSADLRHLLEKIDAGADYLVSQLFFEADDFLRLRDGLAAHGCTVPVIPGVMPLTTPRALLKAVELSGARQRPAAAARLLACAETAPSFRAAGMEFTIRLCARLLAEGVPLLHFYSLNRAAALLEVLRQLRMVSPADDADPPIVRCPTASCPASARRVGEAPAAR